MAKQKDERVFETDRKMELRLRLALNQVGEGRQGRPVKLEGAAPEQETVSKLIDRVRQL